MLGVFLTDAPRRLAAIDDALRNTNARSLQREAHALTGAAASIGATVLHDRCRALEEMGRSASLDGAPDVVRQIHSEFDRVRDEISGLLP